MFLRLWAFSNNRPLRYALKQLPTLQQARCRSWTTEEKQKVAALHSEGHNDAFIGDAIGRSENAVLAMRYHLRHAPAGGPTRRSWTEEDRQKVAELRRQRIPVSQIARLLDRSCTSITTQIWNAKRRLQESPFGARPHSYRRALSPQRAWDSEEEQRLIQLRDHSPTPLSWAQISELMNRSVTGVKHRYYRFTRRDPASTASRNLPWTAADTATALKMAAAGSSFEDIGDVLGRSCTAVKSRYHLARHGKTPPPRRGWKATEEATMFKMRSEGATWSDIAVALGRTPTAIRSNHSDASYRGVSGRRRE